MERIGPVLLLVALLGSGCGSGSDSGGGPSPEPIDASALIDSAKATVEKAAAEEAARCLALVQEGNFSEAVGVCTRAQGMNPYNEEVRLATEQATKESRDGAIRDCLAQVKAEEFARALETCGSASGMAPDDKRVKDALELAQVELAQMADEAKAAAAASGAGAGEATPEAGQAAPEAAKAAPEPEPDRAGEPAPKP